MSNLGREDDQRASGKCCAICSYGKAGRQSGGIPYIECQLRLAVRLLLPVSADKPQSWMPREDTCDQWEEKQ